MPSPLEYSSPESLSFESRSPKFVSSESLLNIILPEHFPPESPSLEYLSSKSSSPESPLPKSNSTESPSSESSRSTPQPSQFVGRRLKVKVWVDALVENGGPNIERGRGSPILCDSLLDIDSSQEWWKMLRNLQRIIDLQFLSLSEENPKIIDVLLFGMGMFHQNAKGGQNARGGMVFG